MCAEYADVTRQVEEQLDGEHFVTEVIEYLRSKRRPKAQVIVKVYSRFPVL